MEAKKQLINFVIKDFNITPPNKIAYDLESFHTETAIKKFVEQTEVYGEFYYPDNDMELDDKFYKVHIPDAVIKLTSLKYDEVKKQIIGDIEPVGNLFPNLLENISDGSIVFSLRSICKLCNVNNTELNTIIKIITFDVMYNNRNTMED